MSSASSSSSEYSHKPGVDHHSPFTAEQEYGMSKLGMWIFLATELLFFCGLFVTYTIFRYKMPDTWLFSSGMLSWKIGAVNTIVLLLSSFTVAWSVDAVKRNQIKTVNILVIITLLCAATFMVNKGFEYSAKTHEYEAPITAISQPYAKALQKEGKCTEKEVNGTKREVCKFIPFNPDNIGSQNPSKPVFGNMFFVQYFVMTGIHGLHVVIGIGLFIWVLMLGMKNKLSNRWNTPVEVVGLYWHLVDLIWIYIFPLLYLTA